MQIYDVTVIYKISVQLNKIFNNPLKYCWVAMDPMCQKLTLTLVYIVKCTGVYMLLNSL